MLNKRDASLIARAADRAISLTRTLGLDPDDRRFLFVGLCVAHQHCPLDLDLLLDADDVNFAHDVFGIMRHLDMKTGELRDCFMPRMAKVFHQHAP